MSISRSSLSSALAPADTQALEARYSIPDTLPAYVQPKIVDPKEIYDGPVRRPQFFL